MRDTPGTTKRPKEPSDPPGDPAVPRASTRADPVDASTDVVRHRWFTPGPFGQTEDYGRQDRRASGLSTSFDNSRPGFAAHPQPFHGGLRKWRAAARGVCYRDEVGVLSAEPADPGSRTHTPVRPCPRLLHRRRSIPAAVGPICRGIRNAQRNRRFLTAPSSSMQAREPTCRCKHRRDQQVFEAPLGKTKCNRRRDPTGRDLSTTFEVRRAFSTRSSTPRPRGG